MRIIPLTLKEANDLVARWHRHHRPVQGHRFSVGIVDGQGEFHGAAIIGRPVARQVDWRTTAEVTRLVTDGTKNACSCLYGAAARVAREMGFESIRTYILASEPGTSLLAAGWTNDGPCDGGSWSRTSRLRDDKHPLDPKVRWVKRLRQQRAADD